MEASITLKKVGKKIDDKTITDKDFLFNYENLINKELKYVVIYVGKKKYGVVQLVS